MILITFIGNKKIMLTNRDLRLTRTKFKTLFKKKKKNNKIKAYFA